MEFKQEDLLRLAEQFEKKAEQFLETASSIRESASVMACVSTSPATSPSPCDVEVFVDTPKPAPEAEVETRPSEFDATIRLIALTPLEKRVAASLWGQIAGREVEDIAKFCKKRGLGTKQSVQHALSCMKKNGYVVRLGRGRYALHDSFHSRSNGTTPPLPPVINVPEVEA